MVRIDRQIHRETSPDSITSIYLKRVKYIPRVLGRRCLKISNQPNEREIPSFSSPGTVQLSRSCNGPPWFAQRRVFTHQEFDGNIGFAPRASGRDPCKCGITVHLLAVPTQDFLTQHISRHRVTGLIARGAWRSETLIPPCEAVEKEPVFLFSDLPRVRRHCLISC